MTYKSLGFDSVTVTEQTKRLVGVRIAQGVICRENVDREDRAFRLAGSWQGREAHCELQATNEAAVVERLKQLKAELALQPADKEHVAAATPSGTLTWDVATGSFADLYGPEVLYPLIERHCAAVRSQGLRVTGYLEAQEVRSHGRRSGPTGELELTTRDHGITISITVDDPATGAVGATKRASVHAPAPGLDQLLADAFGEALRTCTTSGSPRELAPGDYTVVFHPAAVQDLVSTAQMYSLFDRRKVDEGRTFLSGKLGELRFPEGLRLALPLSAALGKGVHYADLPLNHRLVPCSAMELIGAGRVRDLHVSPFWGQRLGIPETFQVQAAPPTVLDAVPGAGLAGKHRDLAALIAGTERGIYVANMWYLRMVTEMDGTLTGMTRDGLYEIKDGKLAGPLLNMRWHDNPFRVLSAIDAMTDERLTFGRSRLAGTGRTALSSMPAVRARDFHFSSVTRF